jgi:DNA-binding ferritin-like protein
MIHPWTRELPSTPASIEDQIDTIAERVTAHGTLAAVRAYLLESLS